MTQKSEKRKIKLRYDIFVAERLEKSVSNFVDFANNRVIPLMRKLKLEVTKEKVMKYAANSDTMKAEYILRERDKAKIDNEYLNKMVMRDAGNEFDEAFDIDPFDNHRTYHPELIILKDGVLALDYDAIEEAATVYVEDEDELDAYDRHQAAVEALNKFFNGKAPQGYGGLEAYFVVVNGVVEPGTTLVNYKAFVKH